MRCLNLFSRRNGPSGATPGLLRTSEAYLDFPKKRI